MSDLREFLIQIRDHQSGIPRLVQDVHRKLTLEGLRRITMRTPVETGHAKINWQIGVGEMPQGVKGKRVRRKKGEPRADSNAAFAKVMAEEGPKVEQIPPFGVSFVTNNVEYIGDLEDGHSRQAPQGMMALSFAELAELKL